MSLLAAIDPGTTGGIAWLDESGTVQTCSMANRGAFIEACREWYKSYPFEDDEQIKVYIEHVTGYIAPRKQQAGEKPEFSLAGSGFAMFNFGKSAGIVYGICEAFGIVPVEVHPATWQKACFVKKSGTRQEWKSKLREVAQRRYPTLKVTLANCDALLLLSYATLMTRGAIDTAPTRRMVIE